ncbi:hypothetical protein BH11CYA1_BH11CYA1_39710 [soil metagenome]
MLETINLIHEEFKGAYGPPMMLKERHNRGLVVNHKMVESLMAENGVAAKTEKKFRATTNSNHKLLIIYLEKRLPPQTMHSERGSQYKSFHI